VINRGDIQRNRRVIGVTVSSHSPPMQLSKPHHLKIYANTSRELLFTTACFNPLACRSSKISGLCVHWSHVGVIIASPLDVHQAVSQSRARIL